MKEIIKNNIGVFHFFIVGIFICIICSLLLVVAHQHNLIRDENLMTQDIKQKYDFEKVMNDSLIQDISYRDEAWIDMCRRLGTYGDLLKDFYEECG